MASSSMLTRTAPRSRRTACLAVVALLLVAACGDDDTAAPRSDDPAADQTAPAEPPGEGTPSEHLEAVGPDAWTPLADAPVALTEVDAAAFGGELWVVGGLAEDGSVVTLVQVYDPATDTWRQGPELPEPVHHAALVATDDALVLIGGYRTLRFDPVPDVWILTSGRQEWVRGTDLPEARGAGAADFDGERIVYGGGIGPDGLADDVWALDLADGGWVPVGRLSVARDHLDATSDRAGTVWFLAGRENSLERNLATVDVVRGDAVTVLGELPTARGGVAAFHLVGLGACLSGGEAPDATFEEVECIDGEGEVTVLPGLGQARHGHGADVIDGVVLVALGGPEPMLTVSASLEALRP
jgi:hypothetical protein